MSVILQKIYFKVEYDLNYYDSQDLVIIPNASPYTAVNIVFSGGGIPEAPIDGKQYGRENATWTETVGTISKWN